MTAVKEGAATLPPRMFVRTAWALHLALLRFSGGRIGLTRPNPGDKFGMLRLTTVGRRAGQPRSQTLDEAAVERHEEEQRREDRDRHAVAEELRSSGRSYYA